MAQKNGDGETIKLVPCGAWDTHCHVFENDRFSFAAGRHFTPSNASLDSLLDMHHSLGISNVCITHGFAYGPDCTSLLNYMARYPSGSKTRGICVLDIEFVSDETLDLYHEAGVRSVRINLVKYSQDEETQISLITSCAKRLELWTRNRKSLGQSFPRWSIQVQQPRMDFWPRLRATANNISPRLVIDHFSLIRAPSLSGNTAPLETPGFQDLLGALLDGNTWIKLSAPYRCSSKAPDYEDMEDIVKAIVAVASHRILWGSDWPHTQNHEKRAGKDPSATEAFQTVDLTAWIHSLRRWMSDEDWSRMWVENPQVLYDA